MRLSTSKFTFLCLATLTAVAVFATYIYEAPDDAAPAEFSADGFPKDIGDGWSVDSLSGSNSNLHSLRKVIRDGVSPAGNFHSVVVERHGKLIADFYFQGNDRPIDAWFRHDIQFGPYQRHDVRSISKSVTGLLVGITRDQGKLLDLDTPVLDYFKDLENLDTPERRAITLKNLLTMSSGLRWDESGSYFSLKNSETRMALAWNKYRYALNQPLVTPPGETFNYNGGSTALLGEIIERVTNEDLVEYAQTHLFAPLHISDLVWQRDKSDKALAYSGLQMRPRDLLKIGRLLLNKGQWHGRQIVSAQWVDAIFQPQISAGDGLQYSHQWWLGTVANDNHKMKWVGAIGNGGQRLFILQELDLCVVITAGRYNQPENGKPSHVLLQRIASAVDAAE